MLPPSSWQIVPWRNVGGFDAIGVTEVQRAGDIIAAHHSATLARTSVRNVGEEQIALWRDGYVATWRNSDRHVVKRQRKWLWGRPARDGSEIPYFLCWASAGASIEQAKPYVYPPWEPKSQ
jgi:hypothetical protein